MGWQRLPMLQLPLIVGASARARRRQAKDGICGQAALPFCRKRGGDIVCPLLSVHPLSVAHFTDASVAARVRNGPFRHALHKAEPLPVSYPAPAWRGFFIRPSSGLLCSLCEPSGDKKKVTIPLNGRHNRAAGRPYRNRPSGVDRTPRGIVGWEVSPRFVRGERTDARSALRGEKIYLHR